MKQLTLSFVEIVLGNTVRLFIIYKHSITTLLQTLLQTVSTFFTNTLQGSKNWDVLTLSQGGQSVATANLKKS